MPEKFYLIILSLLFPILIYGQEVPIPLPVKLNELTLEQTEQLISKNPSGELFFRKGVILAEKFDYQGSTEALRQALLYDSTNTVYLTELADQYITLGNNYDALSVLRKALDFSPENLSIKGKYGKLLMNMQDYKTAYQIFTEVRTADTLNLFFNKQLALSAAYLGKNREAKFLFRSVLKMNPRDFGSTLSLATLLQQDTAYSDATVVLTNGLREYPGNGALLLKRAQINYLNNNYTRAIIDYEAYMENNDTLVNVRKEYGVCLYLVKKEDQALRMLEPLLYIIPNDPFVAMYVGLCYMKLKDFDNAGSYLQLAARLAHPGYLSNIYESLGQVYGLTRQFKEAMAMYKKAYELDDQNYELLFEMGTTSEEYVADKTVAYQYYRQYLEKAGKEALNREYATQRMARIKEKLFMGE